MAWPAQRFETLAHLSRLPAELLNTLQDAIINRHHSQKILSLSIPLGHSIPSGGTVGLAGVAGGSANWGWEFQVADTVGHGIALAMPVQLVGTNILSIALTFNFITAGTTGSLNISYWKGAAVGSSNPVLAASGSTSGGTNQTITLTPTGGPPTEPFDMIAIDRHYWISVIIGSGWNRLAYLKTARVTYQRLP